MSKCTAAQAIKAMEYWEGYKEKATSRHVSRRDKAVFDLDAGANNYTYPGYLCGINGPEAAWCAMQVTTGITEACGNSKADAKAVMWGVWPYSVCDQLWNAAPANMKGKRGEWLPIPGDIIIFKTAKYTYAHTGMVYACDGTYVYIIEGNSSNMCKRRCYLLTSDYIMGYVRPDYADATGEETVTTSTTGNLYGPVCCTDPELHELSKGVAGPEVKTIQRILYARGLKGEDGSNITVDGDFGRNTKAAVIALQKQLFPSESSEWDGVVGKKTWTAALTKLW